MAFFNPSQKLSDVQSREIADMYAAGHPISEIAAKYDVTLGLVCFHARKHAIPKRNVAAPNPEKACAFCGTLFLPPSKYRKKRACSVSCARALVGVTSRETKLRGGSKRAWRGYTIVPIPVGHVSRTSSRLRKDRIAEHILVAEAALGRPLKRGEVVHHINCNKLDNRAANLLICTRPYHAWLHGEMSRRWAQEHLA